VIEVPLVFLHGFTGSVKSWEPILARIPKSRCVRCEPIFGHHPTLLNPAGGAVTKHDLEPHSFDGEVRRLAERIADLGRPVHLVGYSLGARLALSLAVHHPDHVARATLIGCNPGLTDEGARRERIATDARWAALLRTQGIEQFADAWESQPLLKPYRPVSPSWLSRVRAIRRQHDPEGLARALEILGLGQMPALHRALPYLRMPIDLVAGEYDPKFAAIMTEMAHVLPCARTWLVPQAAHDVVLEQPDILVNILLSDHFFHPRGGAREHDHDIA
jgi:2-succinyl-6-hydroxy-2,4-cyclohexadiene-1-carboxylate synthase